MELLGNNPSMQDLIEKLNEVVGSLNNSLPNTDSEIAEVKKLVSFGSGVLAGRLNAKLWYFKTQELMTASTELCEGDSCFVLKDGVTTGEGTFEYWYIYKTSDVVDIIDSYVDLSNPDLVAVKLQDMTLKDVKDTLSAQISDQSKDLNTKISNLRIDTETALSGKADLVNGLIPASQLPSYVDDIVESWLEDIEFPENAYAKEDAEMTTPLTPEFSKIYVNLLNNKTYRWGGNFYVEVSKSLAIGETATTAFAGDRGKAVEEGLAFVTDALGYVTYKMFDAKLDGITNDYEAIKSCHDYANENNIHVLNTNIRFKIEPSNPIVVKTDCDFTGSEMIVDSGLNEQPIFYIKNSDEFISNTGKLSDIFTDKKTPKSTFNNKFIAITYPYSVGCVSGEITKCIEPFGESKSILSINSYDENADISYVTSNLYENPITFKGLKISDETTVVTGEYILCERNNTKIDNITLNCPNKASGISYGSMIRIYRCNGVTVSNIYHNGYAESSQYHYAVRFDVCSSCSIDRLISKSKWHSFVSNSIKDFSMSNCDTELFDTHSGLYVTCKIEHCTFNQPIALGYGTGTIKISNCFSKSNLVTYRTDSALCYRGVIIIDSCEVADGNYLFDSNTGNEITGIDDIFKTTENREIIISNTASRCWYTICTKNDYCGELDIKINSASYAYCGGIAQTNSEPSCSFSNCYIPDLGGTDSKIKWYIYNSKFRLGYIGANIIIHNSEIELYRTDGGSVSTASIKAFDCNFVKGSEISGTGIINSMYINCSGVIPAAKNMYALGCRYIEGIGLQSYPLTGKMISCTTTNRDNYYYQNIDIRNCYDNQGVFNNANLDNDFIDF